MPTPQDAINELLEMSPGIRQAMLVRGDSDVLAGTYGGGATEDTAVAKARSILEEARAAARDMDRPPLNQLLVQTGAGCLFIVVGDNDTWIAVITGANPTVGLVLYDASTALKTALEGEAGSEASGEEEDG
jgi:predicted regulator of Ras-like GTPase activity (Roadblock/LC7/MglB family)